MVEVGVGMEQLQGMHKTQEAKKESKGKGEGEGEGEGEGQGQGQDETSEDKVQKIVSNLRPPSSKNLYRIKTWLHTCLIAATDVKDKEREVAGGGVEGRRRRGGCRCHGFRRRGAHSTAGG